MKDPNDLTQLLSDAQGGDASKRAELLELVYARFHEIAERLMARESPGHTLQPTVLVHEAWLQLVDQQRATWESRGKFFSVAAQVMRRMLVKHARDRRAVKRGGALRRSVLDSVIGHYESKRLDVVELDDALMALGKCDDQAARVVELRFFGGLTAAETAETLGVPLRTVERSWVRGRNWLRSEMRGETEPS